MIEQCETGEDLWPSQGLAGHCFQSGHSAVMIEWPRSTDRKKKEKNEPFFLRTSRSGVKARILPDDLRCRWSVLGPLVSCPRLQWIEPSKAIEPGEIVIGAVQLRLVFHSECGELGVRCCGA